MARGFWVGTALFVLVLAGCGAESGEATLPAEKPAVAAEEKPAAGRGKQPDVEEDFQPLTLDPVSSGPVEGPLATGPFSARKTEDSVVEALRPFNAMLGQWEGKTRKQFDGFARVDSVEWVWDFKTDRSQPSVAFHSDKSPYFQHGWLTYLADKDVFRLTTESPEKERRVFEGTWLSEPRQESDGKKLQWSYKLKLTQVEPAEGDQLQVELSLLENNRYHLTLARRPAKGSQFVQLDVVGTQRKNTSFAVADSDNPGPKCIVSGGLGTTSVTYQGKTYYVCCSGCAAAFEEDPERWLAKKAKEEADKSEE